MRKYHALSVTSLEYETSDSVRVAFAVPESAISEFDFLPGQHLPVQIDKDGKPVRRTYSICSAPGQFPLEIGVRIQAGGKFSEFVANELRVGDRVDVMPPIGQFHATINSANSKTYLAFASGSGITPILAILRTTLEREPQSRFVLFYGNRFQRTTMFIDDLFALKNRFPERLQLYFLFSREEQEFEVFSGRLDAAKVVELFDSFCAGMHPDEAFVCGPDSMIASVKSSLVGLGMNESDVHVERFGAPRKQVEEKQAAKVSTEKQTLVNVIMDGHTKSFEMPSDGGNIVDAAADQGIELPYSCKGGVCATCRTYVREGEVRMLTNYGLEPWEVEKGFVLACQSVPVSDKVTIDYDEI